MNLGPRFFHIAISSNYNDFSYPACTFSLKSLPFKWFSKSFLNLILMVEKVKDNIIKKYALDKISDVRRLQEKVKGMPDDLDDMLSSSVNVWFEKDRTTEVVIEVDAQWAHYFRRRKILPLQETVIPRSEGSLVLRFLACSDEEIAMCLKPWLPHVRVLRPAHIKDELMKEFKKWIAWQKAGAHRFE
jgi:hypothetical protein